MESFAAKKSKIYCSEIKRYIVCTDMTTTEEDCLSDEYGWSRGVSNLSGNLKRGSLRSAKQQGLQIRWGIWQSRDADVSST